MPPRVGGRYHRRGELVLYLSDRTEGVVRETQALPPPKWIQDFDLPLNTLDVADCAGVTEDHFVGAALYYAERVQRFEPATTLAFSQRIADLLREHPFDGMIVRRARGQYRNVVIFDPGDRWERWAVGTPRPLS